MRANHPQGALGAPKAGRERSHRRAGSPNGFCTALTLLALAVLAMAFSACGGGSRPGKLGAEESQPDLSIEVPTDASLLLPFRVAGWAIDRGATAGTGVDLVEMLDGGCNGEVLGRAEYGITRQDIATKYGDRFSRSGWQFIVDQLPVGEHILGVRMQSSLSKAWTCKTLTVSIQ